MINVTTTDGKPPAPGMEHGKASAPQPVNPATGQHAAYFVLSEEERAKGFVRPVRTAYIHTACGSETKMNRAIAETYSRDPSFYGSTFCVHCGYHFPVGQFKWSGTDEIVGS